MSVAIEIVVIGMAVLSGLVVAGLFLWAAFKDGEDNDAIQASFVRRRWPRKPA